MSAREPYFWVRHFAARPASEMFGTVLPARRAYWLVDFRAGNHRNVFNGQRWHSERAALHAIALIDPTGQHRVVIS